MAFWLKGNAYEVLQKEGNYSIFLHGIDLTGNDGVVAGKSIVTVAASLCIHDAPLTYRLTDSLSYCRMEMMKHCNSSRSP